jgi:hypothetical protein
MAVTKTSRENLSVSIPPATSRPQVRTALICGAGPKMLIYICPGAKNGALVMTRDVTECNESAEKPDFRSVFYI